MSAEAARRAFDRLERATLGPSAVTAPRRLALAGLVGRTRNALSRRWPTADEVRALFPELSRRRAESCARAIAAGAARDRWVVATLSRHGLDALRPVVSASGGFATLTGPAVLFTFHGGAWNALGPALERLPGPILSIRQDGLYDPPPPIEVVTTGREPGRRAAALYRAAAVLDRGGLVVAALDVRDGEVVACRCLGRRLEVARGCLALSRRSGAPLVPVTGAWRRGRIVVDRHDPPIAETGDALAADALAQDRALGIAAADWLERYLRAHPAETGLGLLRTLLAAPAPAPSS